MPRITTTTDNAPRPAGPYSQHARIGNVVQAAGQVGFLPDGTLVDGVGEQTRQALNNVLAVLEAGGASEADIISVRVFLTDVSQFEEMNAVYETVFTDPPPARTTIYVGLPPGLLVEIDALAVVEDASCKLLRVGERGAEKPALLDGDVLLDLSARVADFDAAFFAGDGITWLRDLVASGTELPTIAGDPRVGSPIAPPGKVVCIGLNYADHAAESGAPIPTEPIMFMKGSDTVIGPYDDVRIPRNSTKTDYEVELAIVIGREARYLASREAAAAVIAGFCVANDVSEREFQLERGGQWDKGKSCETFNPLGPWLVTPDEIADPQDLAMSLDVNGDARQRGTTSTMIFDVLEIIRYLSQFLVLQPGDLINTGTPPGVGMGMKPPTYLRAGDVMELTIAGLGTQRQRLVPAP